MELNMWHVHVFVPISSQAITLFENASLELEIGPVTWPSHAHTHARTRTHCPVV